MFKRFTLGLILIFFAAGTLAVTSTNSVAAGNSAEMFAPQPWNDPSVMKIEAVPGHETNGWASRLFGEVLDSGGHPTKVTACSSLTDSACKDSNYWTSKAIVPFCTQSISIDCISAVSAEDSNGKSLSVSEPIKFMGSRGQDFAAEESAGLPAGSFSSVVDIPQAPHDGGSLYLPVVTYKTGLNSVWSPGIKFNSGGFNVSIYAVTLSKGNFFVPQYSTNVADMRGIPDMQNINIANGQCVQNDASNCAYAVPLPLNIKFGLTLRTSTPLTGWYSGRIANPDFSISKDSQGANLLTVKGLAVQVPLISHQFKIDALPGDLKSYYTSPHYQTEAGGGLVGEGFHATNRSMEEVFAQFLKWMPLMNDKADATPTLWQFSDMNNVGNGNSCFQNNGQVLGVVNTNAIVYIDGPPAWDASTQSLTYKVAAPHYSADGSVFKGTYDLALRSSTARCLYGFSNAPVSATIEVQSSDGSNQVATTLLRESDGWLYLSASGFTFSSPTIRVKLTQEAAAPVTTVVAPTMAPATVPATKPIAKAITITCVKGKTSKKVTAVKPTCPSGYKKK